MVESRETAEKYLQSHNVRQLMAELSASLLYAKPADPRKFLIAELKKMKSGAKVSAGNGLVVITMWQLGCALPLYPPFVCTLPRQPSFFTDADLRGNTMHAPWLRGLRLIAHTLWPTRC